ncbi:MAG: MBL fold metallo-hydrolase [Candidatus Buchananbacteria bacterium]
MNIYWYGQSFFKIEGDKSVLVIDPFDNSFGLKLPRLSADVVTVSHDHSDHNNVDSIKGIGDDDPFVITSPGEYEVKGIFIQGMAAFHDDKEGSEQGENIIYRYDIDGISLAHLGDLGHSLTDHQLEKLEGVDILFIPVGGGSTIDAKKATEVISQLEPRIVIPMHYSLPGLKTKTKLDDLNAFCKEIGVCPKEKINKYKITKKDLPQDNLQIIVLEP